MLYEASGVLGWMLIVVIFHREETKINLPVENIILKRLGYFGGRHFTTQLTMVADT